MAVLYRTLRNSGRLHTNILPKSETYLCKSAGILIFPKAVSIEFLKCRLVHWDVKTSGGAKDFVLHLDPPERKILLEELQRMEEDRLRTLSGNPKVIPPPFTQLKHIAMYNAVPFVGFGILDNVIMITAGEYIDVTFGTTLGISTMAAAALGNMVSDVAGVGTAGYVENLVSKLGIKPPDISAVQADHKSTRWASSIGRAIGVSIGCLIGMFPLLFYNEEVIHQEKEKLHPHDHKTDSKTTETVESSTKQ